MSFLWIKSISEILITSQGLHLGWKVPLLHNILRLGSVPKPFNATLLVVIANEDQLLREIHMYGLAKRT